MVGTSNQSDPVAWPLIVENEGQYRLQQDHHLTIISPTSL